MLRNFTYGLSLNKNNPYTLPLCTPTTAEAALSDDLEQIYLNVNHLNLLIIPMYLETSKDNS